MSPRSNQPNNNAKRSATRPFRVIISTGYDITGNLNDNYNMVFMDFYDQESYERLRSQMNGFQLHFRQERSERD